MIETTPELAMKLAARKAARTNAPSAARTRLVGLPICPICKKDARQLPRDLTMITRTGADGQKVYVHLACVHGEGPA